MLKKYESVCVFIRAYNASKFILESLKSLREQTFCGDISITVLYDKGSTDDTIEILQGINVNEFNTINRKLEVIEHPNLSPFRSLLTYGFEKFANRYSYYTILDYDNLFAPDYFEIIIEQMKKDNTDFMYSFPVKIDISGETLGILFKKSIISRKYLKYRIILSNFIDANSIFLNNLSLNVILSKLRKLKSKTYDWIFEDWIIGAIGLKCCNFDFLSSSKVYYRIHDSNITALNRFADTDRTNYNREMLTISALRFLNNNDIMIKFLTIVKATQITIHSFINK